MEYPTKQITIGTWSGLAYLIDGKWYIRAKVIAEALGVDWNHCLQHIRRHWPRGALHAHYVIGDQSRTVLVLTVGTAVQWLGAFAGNTRMADERRESVLAMAAAIGEQYAAWALADAQRTTDGAAS